MNTGHERNDHDFDAHLRQVHAHAVDRVAPRTLAQLRPRREATRATPYRAAWPLAATCAVALVAGGMLLRHPTQTVPAPAPATPTVALVASDNEPGDVYAALDESPELYLWLGSNDTATLITE